MESSRKHLIISKEHLPKQMLLIKTTSSIQTQKSRDTVFSFAKNKLAFSFILLIFSTSLK